jgi:hypothetical protein
MSWKTCSLIIVPRKKHESDRLRKKEINQGVPSHPVHPMHLLLTINNELIN